MNAERVSTEDTSPTPPTFQSDAPEKIVGELLIDGAVKIGGVERIEEAALIAGATKRDESGRSAGERTESAAPARTAAT